MVKNNDFLARQELAQLVGKMENGEGRLVYAENPKIHVMKSIEVNNSAKSDNNNLIVSFVKYEIQGVEYREIDCFRKDSNGRFICSGVYRKTYDFEKDKATEEDKSITAQIEKFIKSGEIE